MVMLRFALKDGTAWAIHMNETYYQYLLNSLTIRGALKANNSCPFCDVCFHYLGEGCRHCPVNRLCQDRTNSEPRWWLDAVKVWLRLGRSASYKPSDVGKLRKIRRRIRRAVVKDAK